MPVEISLSPALPLNAACVSIMRNFVILKRMCRLKGSGNFIVSCVFTTILYTYIYVILITYCDSLVAL